MTLRKQPNLTEKGKSRAADCGSEAAVEGSKVEHIYP
jgi:hypothetical protein